MNWAPPIPLPALMSGLRADSGPAGYPSTTVFFEPGFFADMGGAHIWTVPSNLLVDPTVFGPGGRDRVDAWSDGQAIYFYFIADTNGNVSGLCSPGYIYGDVIVPSGYILLRKHPFAINWRSAWGDIPAFHFAGIQNPRVQFSFPGRSCFQIAVPVPPINTPVSISLSPYLPVGSARMALLRFAIYPYGSTAGTAYLGPDSGSLVELGAVNPALGGATRGYIEMRCQSDGTIVYERNSTAVLLALWLEGFVVTEVTT